MKPRDKLKYNVVVDGKTVDFPDKLYKFLAPEHARALIERGSTRIGTLHEYRRQERHGHQVLDVGEGTLRHTERIITARGDQITPYTRALFNTDSPLCGLQNGNVAVSVEVPDLYLYCLSLSQSWEAKIDPSYTVCVEIFEPIAFMLGVLQILQRKHLVTRRSGFGAVVYAGRNHMTSTFGDVQAGGVPAPIPLLKPFEYRDQKEYRFVFEPSARPIDFHIGANRALRDHCQIHSYRPEPSTVVEAAST
jgi:hypothetical protein